MRKLRGRKMPDEAAAAMARKRWAKTTKEERSQNSRMLARLRWGPPKKAAKKVEK
jgi:hypothetical protein